MGAQGHFNYLAYTAAGCITLILLYFIRQGVIEGTKSAITCYPTHFSCLVRGGTNRPGLITNIIVT